MNKNVLKTATMLAGLGGLCVLIGQLLGGGAGAAIGLIIGLVMVGSSYWFSDKLAIRSAGAREVTATDAPELHRIVAELAQRAEIPMPRVYVAPTQQPNAFATGRNPAHAAVCVTEGLLAALPMNEVRGVLAHELAHVKHRDILIGSVAAAIATGISFTANMAMWAGMFGGRDRDDDRSNPVAIMALAVLAPMAAGVMQMALSRSREFEADRLGAKISGDPQSLATALQRIEGLARQVPMRVNPQQATAYIVNPLTGRKVSFSKLFLTHPPTEERVARLLGQAAAA